MKPIVISSLEWKILALFGVGLSVNHSLVHLDVTSLLALYIFGMFFEFTTASAWDYNPVLKKSTFTLHDRDVSLIFGLGWVGNLILGKALGGTLSPWISQAWLADAIGLLIVGNIMEQLFLYFKLWTYNTHSWVATLGTGRPIMIAGIPIVVRTGYFTLGVVVHFLLTWTQSIGC